MAEMKGWLKPKSAAQYCDVGERTMRTWLKEEGLRHTRIRGTILIKIEWLDEFLTVLEVNDGSEVDRIVNGVMEGLEL
jgi:excisionase family DNA binding protein